MGRCWSTERLLALAALVVLPGRAEAGDSWPKPLYAGVVVATEGDADPAVVARSLNEAVSLLIGSGHYRVRDQDDLGERLGGSPGDQARRCQDAPSCWQTLLWRGGVDVVVLLELSTPGDRSVPVCRVSAWGAEGPLEESLVMALPRGGGAPLEWMAGSLLGPGELSLSVAGDGQVTVDGRAWAAAGGPQPLVPGRHQVRVQFGEEVQVQVVPILPGTAAALALSATPPAGAGASAHRRWGLVAAPILAAGGVVALTMQRDQPGDAAR